MTNDQRSIETTHRALVDDDDLVGVLDRRQAGMGCDMIIIRTKNFSLIKGQ